MPLSRLEKVAAGLIVVGGLSLWGGGIAAQHFRSQIKIDVPVAKVRELEEKIGSVSYGVHDMFYRRDPKGYDRPAPDFLNPENRQAIVEAWRDYDRLMAQYEAAISQPEVKELIEKNRSLRNSAMDSHLIADTASILLITAGGITYLADLLRRKKNVDYAEGRPASAQGGH